MQPNLIQYNETQTKPNTIHKHSISKCKYNTVQCTLPYTNTLQPITIKYYTVHKHSVAKYNKIHERNTILFTVHYLTQILCNPLQLQFDTMR